MGRYAGRLIADEVSGRSDSASRAAFTYADNGSMAVIGKAKAVAQIGRFHLSGFLGWVAWGGIHIAFLIGFRQRLKVLMSWFWNWLLNSRDARIITGDAALDIHVPRSGDFVRGEEAPEAQAELPAEPIVPHNRDS